MKTFIPSESEMARKWVLVDADEQILGRLAVKVANILRGKDKACFAPHLDCGDHVVVVNAQKVALSGRKEERKMYEDYTRHMGGRRLTPASVIRARKPERMIRDAVWGMLPKGPLGRRQLRNLKIYAGGEHEHAAQKPVKIEM